MCVACPPPPPPQSQYEQRCSQLVGLALCAMNFTGHYPEFVKLRGTGYAIRTFGEQYIMVSGAGGACSLLVCTAQLGSG